MLRERYHVFIWIRSRRSREIKINSELSVLYSSIFPCVRTQKCQSCSSGRSRCIPPRWWTFPGIFYAYRRRWTTTSEKGAKRCIFHADSGYQTFYLWVRKSGLGITPFYGSYVSSSCSIRGDIFQKPLITQLLHFPINSTGAYAGDQLARFGPSLLGSDSSSVHSGTHSSVSLSSTLIFTPITWGPVDLPWHALVGSGVQYKVANIHLC